jgi:hypothetical protein
MELPSYFTDFLANIRPTSNQVEDYKTGHSTLRDRLNEDAVLSQIIVSTFLQGSYRRSTAIRSKTDKRADVDVVVVTKLSNNEYTPMQAVDLFVPFLETFYKGKYNKQCRSIGITLSYVDLDLVVTAAPSEAEIGILKSDAVTSLDTPEDVGDWRLAKSWISTQHRLTLKDTKVLLEAQREPEWKISPLLIPDRDKKMWELTHPLAQLRWTWDKNRKCNGHYVNIVKAMKWWRRVRHPDTKYPKGYPLEHLVGTCCPDSMESVAQGVTTTLETMITLYQHYASAKQTPFLPDHGVPQHNVLGRISGEDFANFHADVSHAAKIARRALEADSVRESAEAWRELFGDEFPAAPPSGGSDKSGEGRQQGGYTERVGITTIGGGRYA